MTKKILLYASLPTLAVGLLVAQLASANGLGGFFGTPTQTPQQIATNQSTQFQNEANLLGISVDDVKAAWAKGETLQQLAADHGITTAQLQQKLQDARTNALKTRLQDLVSQGVITQAQADARLQFEQTRAQNHAGHMGMGMRFHGGMGMGL